MKRLLTWLAVGVLVLVLFLFLKTIFLFTWLKWSGERQWKQVQAELRAKGEKLTFPELVPPPPPDSENFFADPVWQELTDKRFSKERRLINQWKIPLSNAEMERVQSLLHKECKSREETIRQLGIALSQKSTDEDPKKIAQLALDLEVPATPILLRIAELSKRPSAFFPIRYQDNFSTALPHLTALMSLGHLLETKAHAELSLGNSSSSCEDLLLLIRLSATLQNKPILLSYLVGAALLKAAVGPLNRGIENHQWSSEELTALQHSLRGVNLLSHLPDVIRGERACVDLAPLWNADEIVGSQEKMSLSGKCGVYLVCDYQKAYADIFFQHVIESMNRHDHPGLNAGTLFYDRDLKGNSFSNKALDAFKVPRIMLSFPVQLVEPAILGGTHNLVIAQTQVSQTLIACALDRYRLAHGSYPASLDSLLPEYLTAIPEEPTTGKPMHYRLLDDGLFLLWAPGWNLQTLNGKPGEFQDEGDIVWNQPLPTKLREESSAKK